MKAKIKYSLSLFLCLVSMTVISCSNNGNSSETSNINFEVIKAGPISGFTDEKTQVINNNEDYQQAMAIVYYNLDQMPVIPDVDFNKYTLILVAAGTKNTDGYAISVDKISKSKGSIVVNVTEISPGKNCVLTQTISSPYQIVKVKKIKKEIKFNIARNTKDCS